MQILLFLLLVGQKPRLQILKKTKKTLSGGLTLLWSICAKQHDSVFKSKLYSHSHAARHNHCVFQAPRKKNIKNRLLFKT